VDTEAVSPRLGRLKGIVEKPDPARAPSNLGVVGRYVLDGRIFEKLRATSPGAGGEIQLTDAIAALMQDAPVFTYEFEGTRYDCGDKLGYLQATVEFGVKHPEFGEAFARYLTER
jgi:UTP--glucose-1-phosphate uridylyltransferase